MREGRGKGEDESGGAGEGYSGAGQDRAGRRSDELGSHWAPM